MDCLLQVFSEKKIDYMALVRLKTLLNCEVVYGDHRAMVYYLLLKREVWTMLRMVTSMNRTT